MSCLKPKRMRGPAPIKPPVERLASVAIQRGDTVESRGFKSHWELRAALGDENPQSPLPDDVSGFLTSTGRFVSRCEARDIGVASGQLSPSWARVERDLLSSDINWGAPK